ncbi:acetoacetyl-CoA reductase [Pokkaliibacter sp. CJK22405]|uniref:acetoacetyl-CoA reductase n=1 Tax=Pokkaliibacter sp. CJK22405 TaxID=3384615 RepID=UPI003984F41B
MSKRIALVTGGTGGIGSAICQELAKQGYQVVAGYNNGGKHEKAQAWQAEMREKGLDIGIAYGDVTKYDSCERCIKEIEEVYGASVSILVNNAGITRDGQFKKMSWEQWNEVLRANLDSMFNMTRLVINPMIEQGWGRVVNISSINAQKGQFGQTNYSAAKAGIHGFTKALAQEVARKGVTVNTVSPGYVLTPMVEKIAPEILEKIQGDIPVGRLGTPEEIGFAVAYLCNDMAGYVTGSNIAINGGQHMF